MCKRIIFYLLLLFVSIGQLKAQKIIFSLSSGTSIFYNLRAIDSIVFEDNNVILALYSGIVDVYPSDSIDSYTYDQANSNVSTTKLQHLPIQQLTMYPNPNKGSFTVDYRLQKDSEVSLVIYNLNGEIVYRRKETRAAGAHKDYIDLDENTIGNGMFIIELATPNERYIDKLILNK